MNDQNQENLVNQNNNQKQESIINEDNNQTQENTINENNVQKQEMVLTENNSTINISIEDTAKKVHDKRERNKMLRIFLISILGFIALIVALFFVLIHFNKLKHFSYNEEYPLYQYFAGNKEIYTGKVTLSTSEGITKIETNNGIQDIQDAPIYFQKIDNELLTSKNMLLVFPRINNKNYKMKEFTKIVYEKDSSSAFYYLNKDKIYLEDSFLYDGNDLYVFLYETTLIVGEKEYKLSPLSFAIVDYYDQVEFYDKEKDTYTIIDECSFDIIANMSNYKINLSTDMVNDNRLLLKNFDKLQPYKK